MQQEEIYYTIALTRLTGLNQTISLRLYQTMGSGTAVFEHRQEIGDVLEDSTPRLRESLKNWDEALRRAAAEMEFVTQKGIRVLTMNDADYPQRLRECPDAPIVLFYKGSADLNQPYVVDIVGTRHIPVTVRTWCDGSSATCVSNVRRCSSSADWHTV